MSADPAPGPPRERAHWIVWLFATVGLLGILAIIMLALEIMSVQRRAEPAVVAADASAVHFVVRDATPLHGTNLVQIVIGAGSAPSPYSSGGVDDQRNILLLDRTTGAVRRLLPDNNHRIVRSFFLPAQTDAAPDSTGDIARDGDQGGNAPPPAPAYFALLVAQSDNDERLDLVIGTLANGDQVFTMPGLAGVDGVWMQSPTQVALLVREGLNLFYRIVDIPSRRVVLSRRVAI